MKTKFVLVFLNIIILFGGYHFYSNYVEQEKIEAIEASLFKVLKGARYKDTSLNCDPSFVTFRKSELVVFCYEIKDKEKDLVEYLRENIKMTTEDWAKTYSEKVEYIRVRFVNEIHEPSIK